MQSEQVGDFRAVKIDLEAWDIRDATTKSVGVVYKHHGEFVFNGDIKGFSRPTLLALSKFVAKVNQK